MSAVHKKLSILVLEDHALVGQGIVRELESMAHVDTVVTLIDASQYVEEHAIDILIIDLWMPDGDGLDWYSDSAQKTPTILLSGQLNLAEIQRAQQLGVRHIVSKSSAASELRTCVESILAGEPSYYSDDLKAMAESLEQGNQLSENAIAVLRGLQEGLANKQIAKKLEISEATVSFHLGQLKKILKARTNRELVFKASRLDLTK